MNGEMPRREFLAFGWKAGAILAAAAGIWTSWDVLRPRLASGLGGEVRTVPVEEVTQETALYVREAQAYLTRRNDDVVALWQRCPHLGCRVAWCESSGEFECACHGSTFNRLGEHRTGPSPSGMQEFAVTVADGIVVVDTGAASDGVPLGIETIDEPRRGPSCTGEA